MGESNASDDTSGVTEANSEPVDGDISERPKNRFGIPYLLATDNVDNDTPKKEVFQLLGFKVSAPAGMKNPMLKMFGLIGVNIFMLVMLGQLLNKR